MPFCPTVTGPLMPASYGVGSLSWGLTLILSVFCSPPRSKSLSKLSFDNHVILPWGYYNYYILF